ncbi:MAG TPA: hydroxymethylglutaryl-CoA lyase [Steroidobacteraceae bacterium]|nr:hydroxymethylglutaryl-CoA lyase [Steroidobacteraceae bacterium]
MRINLLEVGPRDGLQNEPRILPTAAKIELIGRLAAANLRRLEVTSFVNPKRVPQMADAEAVMAGLPARDGVSYIGLVLNRKGFERARAAGCHEIGMAVVASDAFNRRNQGVSTHESVAAWLEIAHEAHRCGIKPHITLSTAFGCPFQGEVDPSHVLALAQECARGEPTEISLADTVGVAVPSQVTDLFGRLRELLPGMPLRGHFHNTRNTGIANAYAAVMAGVETLDASIGGLGGCPFAPAATGNIPTEDLLYMLNRMGFDTGVRLEALIETGRWVQEQVGRPLPGMLIKAGTFPHDPQCAKE